MRERVRELAQKRERGETYVFTVSLDMQQGKKPSRIHSQAWEWGKEVMATDRNQGKKTPGIRLFLSHQEEILSEEIHVKNSQSMDSIPRAP